MNDMAGNAARVAVERSGSCRDTTLSPLLVDLLSAARDFLYDNRVAENGIGSARLLNS
jgi:hypothetical protein